VDFDETELYVGARREGLHVASMPLIEWEAMHDFNVPFDNNQPSVTCEWSKFSRRFRAASG
jgi:hypothetical protein